MPTGQDLGDLFANIGGANINRPQMNAFVAQSQARNGLVSAQTQDALIKASQAQEQQEARGRIKADLLGTGSSESDAQLTSDAMIAATNGDAVTANKLQIQQHLQHGTPAEQVAAQQAAKGEVAPLQNVPNNYAVPAGQAPPNIQQSPQGAAQTADTNSQTALRDAQTRAGGFSPHAGSTFDPNDPTTQQAIQFGSYMLYKTGKMPAMGMGGGPARMAILAGATQLGNQEANGQTVSNPGFDTAIANGQDYTGAQKNLNSQAGGALGNQTRAINNVSGHLQLMENLFTGLQNGDMQIVNKLGNQWNKAFGSPAPTNIQTAAEFIGPEMVKILSNNGSTGTAEERQGFSNTAANLANAPEQTGQAIGTLKNMLGRQLTDMALQYHGATGRSDFARRYVAPDVAQYLEVDPQAAPTPSGPGPTPAPTSPTTSASPAGGAATTLPPQALGALQAHPGQHVTFGNGQVWTLQNGKPTRVQ